MKQHIYQGLAARRRYLGLSQAELAARAGVRREKISRLESKAEDVSFEDLCRILDALGLELALGERQPQAVASAPPRRSKAFHDGFVDGKRARIVDWGKVPR